MQLCITPFPFLENISNMSFYNLIETPLIKKMDINPNIYRHQNHWKTFTLSKHKTCDGNTAEHQGFTSSLP